jgi:hypothetical protein
MADKIGAQAGNCKLPCVGRPRDGAAALDGPLCGNDKGKTASEHHLATQRATA